jgi:uncharacterized protein (TIGR03437 family)
VILKNTLSVRFFVPLLFISGLSAAPRLNLVQTSLTVSVPAGTNGPTYSLDTFNIGDGTLNLTASSSVPWLAPTVGTATLCGLRGGCYPVSIVFQTSALAAGTYTGIITLTDPKAVDSPQYITVTAQVGGDVPSKLAFYLAPGGKSSATFTTNGPVTAKVSANTTWLTTSLATNIASGGYITTVTVTAGSSMATTDYNGTIAISGSSFASDNKQIAVSLNVTTQPIAQASSSALSFNIAQGTAAQSQSVGVTDAGQGTLTVSGVTATATSGGTWLTATTVNGGISVKADPTGLSPNTYTGTVTIASNGLNGSLVIPVELTVAAQGPPVAAAGGVVNNGTFANGEALAQGDVAAIFGGQFSFDVPQFAPTVPLPDILDGVQVLVNGKAAPLYNVYPGQIDFEIPIDAAAGSGTVQVVRNGQAGNLVYVDIAAQVPRFILYDGGYGIVTEPDGSTVTGTPQSQPVKAGDTVVIYAIGLGQTSPPVSSGAAAPSNPLADVPGITKVCFGIQTPFYQAPCVKPSFVGLSPGSVGLYQINATIPSGLPSGNTTMLLVQVDNITSTSAELAVE